MDLMKEFEEYLPKWAEEKMQPIPTQEHTERWNIAWGDFLKEHLSEKYDEMANEYLNMQYKTVGERNLELQARKKSAEKVAEEVVEETVEPVEVVKEPVKQSSWEKVQAILNEKG